jgi:hypothetical protein
MWPFKEKAETQPERRQRYVPGVLCSCGKCWPRHHPFMPFLGIPDVCPICGRPSEKMEPRSLIEEKWQTGKWCKVDHVKYYPGKPSSAFPPIAPKGGSGGSFCTHDD